MERGAPGERVASEGEFTNHQGCTSVRRCGCVTWPPCLLTRCR